MNLCWFGEFFFYIFLIQRNMSTLNKTEFRLYKFKFQNIVGFTPVTKDAKKCMSKFDLKNTFRPTSEFLQCIRKVKGVNLLGERMPVAHVANDDLLTSFEGNDYYEMKDQDVRLDITRDFETNKEVANIKHRQNFLKQAAMYIHKYIAKKVTAKNLELNTLNSRNEFLGIVVIMSDFSSNPQLEYGRGLQKLEDLNFGSVKYDNDVPLIFMVTASKALAQRTIQYHYKFIESLTNNFEMEYLSPIFTSDQQYPVLNENQMDMTWWTFEAAAGVEVDRNVNYALSLSISSLYETVEPRDIEDVWSDPSFTYSDMYNGFVDLLRKSIEKSSGRLGYRDILSDLGKSVIGKCANDWTARENCKFPLPKWLQYYMDNITGNEKCPQMFIEIIKMTRDEKFPNSFQIGSQKFDLPTSEYGCGIFFTFVNMFAIYREFESNSKSYEFTKRANMTQRTDIRTLILLLFDMVGNHAKFSSQRIGLLDCIQKHDTILRQASAYAMDIGETQISKNLNVFRTSLIRMCFGDDSDGSEEKKQYIEALKDRLLPKNIFTIGSTALDAISNFVDYASEFPDDFGTFMANVDDKAKFKPEEAINKFGIRGRMMLEKYGPIFPEMLEAVKAESSRSTKEYRTEGIEKEQGDPMYMVEKYIRKRFGKKDDDDNNTSDDSTSDEPVGEYPDGDGDANSEIGDGDGDVPEYDDRVGYTTPVDPASSSTTTP